MYSQVLFGLRLQVQFLPVLMQKMKNENVVSGSMRQYDKNENRQTFEG